MPVAEHLADDASSGEEGEMPKISADLAARFEGHEGAGDHGEQVIITLAPDADRSVLEAAGITVQTETRNLPIVTGTIDGAGLSALSASDDVIRVELDSGGMRALDDT